MTRPDTLANGKPAGAAGATLQEWPAFYRRYGYGLGGLRRWRRPSRRSHRRHLRLHRLHANESHARFRRHRVCESRRSAAPSVRDRALCDGGLARAESRRSVAGAPPAPPDPGARYARGRLRRDVYGRRRQVAARRAQTAIVSGSSTAARRSRSTRAAAISSGPTIRSTRFFSYRSDATTTEGSSSSPMGRSGIPTNAIAGPHAFSHPAGVERAGRAVREYVLGSALNYARRDRQESIDARWDRYPRAALQRDVRARRFTRALRLIRRKGSAALEHRRYEFLPRRTSVAGSFTIYASYVNSRYPRAARDLFLKRNGRRSASPC